MKPSNLKLFLSAFLLVSVVLFPLHRYPVWAADPLSIVYDPTLDIAVKGVLNAPHNYDEALIGTPLPILPAAGGDLIDAGTADAIRGLDNLVDPYLGAAPDVGAYEPGLGPSWTGPRHFANLLAYGLPKCWRVAPITELSDYASLGAPSQVDPNAFRLLLVTSDPQPPAFILATFEEMQPEARWSRFEELLQPSAGDTVLIPPLYFRDGLGASIVAWGDNTHLLGARVDDEGVLKIYAGVAKASLGAVQEDWFTFVRSLWYAWHLQDADPKIALNFVTPPAPGFVAVGSPAAPSTGNAVVPGTLHGDVTLTNTSVIQDVKGDVNLNATATVQFRRQGTTQWRDALDLHRIKFNAERWSGPTVNRLAGSIFRLAPGTTYEIRVTLSDPDGLEGIGTTTETRTTSFTTRQVPKVPQGGRVIEVRPTDDLDVLTQSAQPGDTFLFHAGTYKGTQYGGMVVRRNNSGTPDRPILFRAYGDGDVNFSGIGSTASHVWFHGLTITAPLSDVVETMGIRFADEDGVAPTGIAVTGNTIQNAYYQISAEAHDVFISDNYLIGSEAAFSKEGVEFEKSFGRGHVVAFNEITKVQDGVSYGDGNIDVHNNRLHKISDDYVEPDYSRGNYRITDNNGWDGGNAGFSFQPMLGGPTYIVSNQSTGEKYELFKLESGSGPKIVVGNSFTSTRGVGGAIQLFDPGSIFANNYWKARNLPGNSDQSLGNIYPPGPDVNRVRLWGYNRYDVVDPNDLWHGGWGSSLEAAQARGAELNSRLVTDRGTEGLQIYEPTAVTLSSNTGSASFTWSWHFSVNGGPEQIHSSGTGSIPSVTFDSKGLANSRVEWVLRASDSAGAQEARLAIDVWPGSCGSVLPSPILCGDVNGDGIVDIRDVIALIRILTGANPTPQPGSDPFRRSDVNGDGTLDIADAVFLIKHLLGQAQLACRGG